MNDAKNERKATTKQNKATSKRGKTKQTKQNEVNNEY